MSTIEFDGWRSCSSFAARIPTAGFERPLVPHLYEEHGTDFLRKLNGMFAILVYHVARGRILIARDRVGIKPMYYHAGPSSLTFGSELQAVLGSDLFPRQRRANGLDQR